MTDSAAEPAGSPPDGVEERRDRVVHGVGLLLVHHMAGVIDDDELRSGDILVEARRSPNIHRFVRDMAQNLWYFPHVMDKSCVPQFQRATMTQNN